MKLFGTPPTARPLVVGLVLTLLLSGCAPSNPFGDGGNAKTVRYVGRLEAVQVTSYMYGSHVLVTEEGRYAVEKAKGSDVRLGAYSGRRVRLEGDLVEGYPVDGGPPLLAVREVHPLD